MKESYGDKGRKELREREELGGGRKNLEPRGSWEETFGQ